ncbi:MAG: hypothetical protein TREMPRED_005974 [Tremellales sp. Tagirdzhanova-0007]|nr:MAG: hypothetical protein TREMPRED_005974 [Tremellales sp. Tagirdzhanova-0007]
MSSAPLSGTQRSSKGATDSANVVKVVAGLVIAVGMGTVLGSDKFCPTRILGLLQAVALPISLASKAPQIISNSRSQSTGNLSAFAVFNALLGCLARLFTTKQEVNDPLIFWGFAGATLLNAVLALQMIIYWRSGEGRSWDGAPTEKRATEEGMMPDSQSKTGVDDGVLPGRRWTRKLD